MLAKPLSQFESHSRLKSFDSILDLQPILKRRNIQISCIALKLNEINLKKVYLVGEMDFVCVKHLYIFVVK